MSAKQSDYAKAGVDIDAGQKAVDLMKAAVQATYTPNVLSDTGNFGGLFSGEMLKQMQHPILVASTDGVGTKTKVASKLNQWDTIGQDLVNHCINDILVQGARPLFFMDYVASSKLIPEQIAAIVSGMATACKAVGCALLGGETAEMPNVYLAGEVDVAGTIVGVVDRPNLIDGSRIEIGDMIFGLPSLGLHTNGFSLARKILENADWTIPNKQLGQSIGEALLAVHRNYLPDVEALWTKNVDIRGLAHITGGGITDNLPRILPKHVSALIRRGMWPVLPIFELMQQIGEVDTEEMYRVFNMGIGMLVIVPAAQSELVQKAIHPIYQIGTIVSGNGLVVYEG
jgi:phosphoribosylformylglycinamidine cyclo-ligase